MSKTKAQVCVLAYKDGGVSTKKSLSVFRIIDKFVSSEITTNKSLTEDGVKITSQKLRTDYISVCTLLFEDLP